MTHTKSSVDVKCHMNEPLCESNMFLIYPQIDYTNFKLSVLLKISESDISFKSFSFNAKTVNPKYTMFMTVLKYSMFFISLIMTIIYSKFYTRLNPFIQTFEHKAIFLLSLNLLFLNDPFCIFALKFPNVIFSILSSFVCSIFISGLIVFWTVMLRRIHREATTPETKLATDKYTILIGTHIRY